MNNVRTLNVIVQFAIIAVLAYMLYNINKKSEGICIKKNYGYVTDVPASTYVDANMALVHSTSLGQAPLGDPRYWLPNRSPITQGMYGLYREHALPISDAQPYDRTAMIKAAEALPVYTDEPLPPQCTPLN